MVPNALSHEVLLEGFRRTRQPCVIASIDGRIMAANQSSLALLDPNGKVGAADLEAEPIRLSDRFDGGEQEISRDLRMAASRPKVPLRWWLNGALVGVRVEVLRTRQPKQAPLLLISFEGSTELRERFHEVSVRVARANEAAAAERRRNAELVSRYDQLRHFSYAMAHDLKAPLRRISLLLSYVREDYGDDVPEEASELLERAGTSAVRLGKLISDLLDYGQIAEISRTMANVDLDGLVDEIRNNFANELDAAGAELVVDGNLGTLQADRVLLKRLLDNLVENAIKYRSPDRPLIIVTSTSSSGTADADGHSLRSISVTDNGQGIDPTKAERLFEPFVRGHAGEIEGSGIGLATCRAICDLHRWSIHAAGQPGESATFTIELDATNVAESLRGTN